MLHKKWQHFELPTAVLGMRVGEQEGKQKTTAAESEILICSERSSDKFSPVAMPAAADKDKDEAWEEDEEWEEEDEDDDEEEEDEEWEEENEDEEEEEEEDGEWEEDEEFQDDAWPDKAGEWEDSSTDEDSEHGETEEIGRLQKWFQKPRDSFGFIECLNARDSVYVYGHVLVTSLGISYEDVPHYFGRFLRFTMIRNHRGYKASEPIELLPEGFEGEETLNAELDRRMKERRQRIKNKMNQERREKDQQWKQFQKGRYRALCGIGP